MTTEGQAGCNPTAPHHRGQPVRRLLWLLVALFAWLALVPAVAQAASAGDFDPSFGTGGQLRVQVGRDPAVPASWAQDIALQPDGKLVLGGGASDPNARHANEFMIARLHANGALDTTFGTDGSVQLQLADPLAISHTDQDFRDLSEIKAVAIQPDGKIIAAGSALVGEAAAKDDHQEFALARLNPDGSLDPSFGSNGVVHVQPNQPGARISDLALQPDGKIIAAGFAQDDTTSDGIIDLEFAAVRLNPDGSLDPSFGEDGKVVTQVGAGLFPNRPNSSARSAVLQPDGRIVLAGSATDILGNDEFALARFNPDGTPDTSFGENGRVRTQVSDTSVSPRSFVFSLARQGDGKLVVGGGAHDPNSDAFYPTQVALARFNPNGGLDASFGSQGKVLLQMADEDDSPISSLHDIAVQSNGKIVAAGAAGPWPIDAAPTYGFLVARFNSNGSIDNSFGTAGKLRAQMGDPYGASPGWSDARGIAIQPDKRVLVAGLGTSEPSGHIAAMRLLGGPTPTASFDFAPVAPRTGEAVTFTSTSGVAGGSIVRSEWDFGEGFQDGGAQVTHTFVDSGTQSVSLRVTDGDGQTATVTRQVVVANRAPSAAFGFAPATPETGESVGFDASGSSDPDGSVAAYSWEFGDGSSASGASPSHAYAQAGSYSVTLTVADDDGATASVSRTVTVAARPPRAVFAFSPAAPSSGQAVSFDGSASETAGGPVSGYDWTFGDGASATGAMPSHTYAKAGSYTVTLTVTASDGATDSQSHTVTVANRLPLASLTASPAAPLTGEQVTFDASASGDPDGSVVLYEWDLDGDGSYETDTRGDPTAARSYARSGELTVRVRVRDDDGASATSSRTLTIGDRAPLAGLSATPNPALVGETVSFDASASADPDGVITRYEWDLDGDGSYETDTATTATTSRAYSAPRAVTVGLQVSDDRGGISQTSVALQIDAPPSQGSGADPPAGEGPDPRARNSQPAPHTPPFGGALPLRPRPAFAGSLVLPRGQTLRAVFRRGFRVHVRCSTACRAHLAITLSPRAARTLLRRRSPRPLVIARATRHLKAGPARLNARLSPPARRLLRKARRITANVRVRITAADEGALTLRRRLVLRR